MRIEWSCLRLGTSIEMHYSHWIAMGLGSILLQQASESKKSRQVQSRHLARFFTN